MNMFFVLIYAFLALITLAALATPQAIATNFIPDANVGALVMIGSIAILMSALVIEIWLKTTPKEPSELQREITAAQKNKSPSP